MKKTIILVFVLTLFTFSTYARGPADKVTGEFTHNDRFHRLVSAHEAIGKNPQKGFFLSWWDNGRWYEIDFWDIEHSKNTDKRTRTKERRTRTAMNGTKLRRTRTAMNGTKLRDFITALSTP